MAISRQELDSRLQNAVCYVHEADDRGAGAVAPLEFVVSYYLDRIARTGCSVLHLTTVHAFDVGMVAKWRPHFDDNVFSKVRIERCLSLAALLDQSQADVDLVVIEDIRGLFNLEFAKNYTGASASMVGLMRKLREKAYKTGCSTMFVERERGAQFQSRPIEQYVRTLYDCEVEASWKEV